MSKINREKFAKVVRFGLGDGRVDRKARTIRGYAVMSRGEALGHEMWVDDETLVQVEKMGTELGEIKSRYTHPGLCEDGLANQIGNTGAFKATGGKVFGDMVFYSKVTAAKQEKIDDILNLAEEDPAKFGASIVFTPDYDAMDDFSLANGGQWKQSEYGQYIVGFKSPDKDNVNNYPHVRIAELHASDIVGDPAANKDGLFGKHQALAVAGEKIFDWLLGRSSAVPETELLGGIDPARVQTFLTAYLQRHGLTIGKGTQSMAKKLEEAPEKKDMPEKKPEEKADDAPKGKTCPDCEDKESPADAGFCAYCGGKFDDAPDGDGEKAEADDEPAGKKDVEPAKTSAKRVAQALAAQAAKEQKYRDEFEGIMVAAQFTAEERETFRAKRFGMEMPIVREFANEAIKNRAKPVGEGGITSDLAQQAANAELATRFASEPRVRAMYSCFNNDPKSDQYKKAFSEYVKYTSAGEKNIVNGVA